MEVQEIRQLLQEFALENRQSIEAIAAEMRLEAVATRRHVDETEAGLRLHFDENAEEIRRHFDAVGEGLRKDVQLVAEQVLAVDEKLDRFRGEVAEELAATKSMIRLSHQHLDRRLTVLEDSALPALLPPGT